LSWSAPAKSEPDCDSQPDGGVGIAGDSGRSGDAFGGDAVLID